MATKKAQEKSLFDAILDKGTANGVNINIKKRILPKDSLRFGLFVLNNVFEGGVYAPELKPFILDCATVQFYTDIELPLGEERYDDVSRFIYDTDVVKKVRDFIDAQYYDDLVKSVDEHIDHINRTAYAASRYGEVYDAVLGLVDKLSDYLDKYGGIIERKLKNMRLDKNSLEKIRGLLGAVSNVTEADIVKEVVAQARSAQEDVASTTDK